MQEDHDGWQWGAGEALIWTLTAEAQNKSGSKPSFEDPDRTKPYQSGPDTQQTLRNRR